MSAISARVYVRNGGTKLAAAGPTMVPYVVSPSARVRAIAVLGVHALVGQASLLVSLDGEEGTFCAVSLDVKRIATRNGSAETKFFGWITQPVLGLERVRVTGYSSKLLFGGFDYRLDWNETVNEVIVPALPTQEG